MPLRRRGVPHLLVRGHVEVGPPEPAIAEDGVHVVVPGHQPVLGGFVMENGGVPAELLVHGVGVRHEGRILRGELVS